MDEPHGQPGHPPVQAADEAAAGRAEAARLDGIELEPLPAPPVRAEDPRDRFWRWVEEDPDPTAPVACLRSTMHHLTSFWAAPDAVDVVFLHYDDLQADLGGQMRTLAEKLGIEVPGDRWPTLVEAATFDAMRQNPEVTVPGVDPTTWRDPARFFHKGTSGQWRQLLNDADVARYAERVRSLGPPELVSWLHRADPAIARPERTVDRVGPRPKPDQAFWNEPDPAQSLRFQNG